ncbi:YceI family protein [Granulicella cerasi]|uniref:YceI family protein n=1 Tax=Granulicella cerasi TaxID=741063 RepID=A0ABW1Z8V4_9BACT
MKKTILAAAAALILSPAMGAFAQASTWTIDSAHSSASFEIRHMGVSNVRGAISNIKGSVVWDEKDLTKDSVVADLDATTVNTNMDARDKHLKSPDFFNVEKFPTIHFQSKKVTREGGKLVVWGDLTLAGVTKPVKLDVDGPVPPQKGMKGGLVSGFSASTVIKRADFGFGGKYAPRCSATK